MSDEPTKLWKCPNCGQVHFGEAPPDMCDFCHDFTTWRAIPAGDEGNKKSASQKRSLFEDEEDN